MKAVTSDNVTSSKVGNFTVAAVFTLKCVVRHKQTLLKQANLSAGNCYTGVLQYSCAVNLDWTLGRVSEADSAFAVFLHVL